MWLQLVSHSLIGDEEYFARFLIGADDFEVIIDHSGIRVDVHGAIDLPDLRTPDIRYGIVSVCPEAIVRTGDEVVQYQQSGDLTVAVYNRQQRIGHIVLEKDLGPALIRYAVHHLVGCDDLFFADSWRGHDVPAHEELGVEAGLMLRGVIEQDVAAHDDQDGHADDSCNVSVGCFLVEPGVEHFSGALHIRPPVWEVCGLYKIT